LVIIGNEDEFELNSEDYENDPELFFPAYSYLISEVEEEQVWGISDHLYTLIEGDDDLPEIALSRFKVPTFDRLTGALQRSIEYEINPLIDNNDWFSRAVLTIESEEAGIHPNRIDLANWERRCLERAGFQDVSVIAGSLEEDDLAENIREVLNAGHSLILADGWLWGCVMPNEEDWRIIDWENPVMVEGCNPFVISQPCLLGPVKMSYPYFASAQPDFYNGPIGWLGLDEVCPSAMSQEILKKSVKTFVVDNIHQPGYLQITTKIGILDIEWIFDDWSPGINRRIWAYGDPTVSIYSSRPLQIFIEHPHHHQNHLNHTHLRQG